MGPGARSGQSSGRDFSPLRLFAALTMTSATTASPRSRRIALVVALLAAMLTIFTVAGDQQAVAAKKPPRGAEKLEEPNIVVITTDDQAPRTQTPESMPNLYAELVPIGTQFTDYIVTTPLCCPSRATLLTGQYGHNNGVLRNFYPDLKQQANVLPAWLQRGGYNTAHVGKFLNAYEANEGGAAAVAPGWDLWFTQLEKRRYYNWKASKNGKVRHFGNGDNEHATAVTNDFATRWTKRLARKKAPFFMQVDHYAPHTSTGRDTRCASGPVPEPIDEHRFDLYEVPQLPNFNEEDVSDKPPRTRDRTVLTEEEILNIERRYRCTLESLYGVDRGIGEIIRVLKERRELNQTVIIFASDNGFFYGEHRIAKGKPSPYEENIHLPLTMYVPPKYRARADQTTTTSAPVANIDVVPTILDLADADPCRSKRICRVLDGRSMMPLLDGTGGWPNPRAIGIELGECDYRGVRYAGQVYFQYSSEQQYESCQPIGTEFYDLVDDPFQLDNLAPLAQHADNVSTLQKLTDDLSDCAGIKGRDPKPESRHYCG